MDALPAFHYVTKRDYHPEVFRRVVVLGESHVAQGIWVSVFAALLAEFQGSPAPEVINSGIGGNVISPRSPGYAASARPSALERYQADLIAHQPDLVIMALGLNDMRSGMPAEAFQEDLAYLVAEARQALDAVIVLTTLYNLAAYPLYPPFDKGSPEAAAVFNLVIRQTARRFDALVADIWAAEAGAPWVITADTVHANRLGHTLIGHCVFQTVAANCSGVAASLKQPSEVARQELAQKHVAALARVRARLATADFSPLP